jgi:hypothetical protein
MDNQLTWFVNFRNRNRRSAATIFCWELLERYVVQSSLLAGKMSVRDHVLYISCEAEGLKYIRNTTFQGLSAHYVHTEKLATCVRIVIDMKPTQFMSSGEVHFKPYMNHVLTHSLWGNFGKILCGCTSRQGERATWRRLVFPFTSFHGILPFLLDSSRYVLYLESIHPYYRELLGMHLRRAGVLKSDHFQRVVRRFAKILASGPPQAPGPASDFADNSY